MKAKAEAEQMNKKAEAWKEYADAAKIDMILDAMPHIAAEVSAPLSHCRKMTMVSSGNGQVGVAKITDEVIQVMERLPVAVKNMTGVDVSKVRAKSKSPFLICYRKFMNDKENKQLQLIVYVSNVRLNLNCFFLSTVPGAGYIVYCLMKTTLQIFAFLVATRFTVPD